MNILFHVIPTEWRHQNENAAAMSDAFVGQRTSHIYFVVFCTYFNIKNETDIKYNRFLI